MYEPPEILSEITTPAKVIAQLDVIRERYRMGLMDPPGFNEVLKLFQFRDSSNRVWSPGARTNQWYRRDGREWVADNPPDQLQMPKLPLELAPEPDRPSLPPTAPTAPQSRGPTAITCLTCGASNVGKKFCTQCGTKL